MENEAERPNASVDIRDVPFGNSGGRSRGPRTETMVSAVNGGEHLNIYPSDHLCEVMEKWKNGAKVRVEDKDGQAAVLRLQAAEHQGHALREKRKSGQRPHFSVPTATIGKVAATIKGRVVQTWTEGAEICIRVSSFFSGGQGQ